MSNYEISANENRDRMQRYSYNIYTVEKHTEGHLLSDCYVGCVIDNTTGQLVFRCEYTSSEEHAIDACLDAIDNLIAEGE